MYEGLENWIQKPYDVIDSIFSENSNESFETFVKKVQECFEKKLSDDSITSIPSLNDVNHDDLKDGALVKYRCMVQDVFDPQFCLGSYKVTNAKTQDVRTECGAFRDFPNLPPDENVDYESRDNVTVDRQSFYCIPVPGEAEWVKLGYKNKQKDIIKSSSSYKSGQSKRERDDEDESITSTKVSKTSGSYKEPNGDGSSNQMNMSEMDTTAFLSNGENKVTSGSKSSSKDSSIGTTSLNFPLPDEKGMPCIVRVYSRDIELKTTDSIEIFGILSIDPQLAAFHDDDSVEEREAALELAAHEPPPSLVPRIHTVAVRPLAHNNPHLPPRPASPAYTTAVSGLLGDVCSLRLELLAVLQHALLGDALAAEYTLLHLLSRVYARADVLPLGKMCLNLTNCPSTQRYTQFFNHLLSNLTTQSTMLEMTIEETNSWRLTPKKDYQRNVLVAGRLQLARGSGLALDETALTRGQLNHQGVMNIKTLADLINWQKVDYDFEYHPIPVHTDLRILILSEGESLLPKDVLLPLKIDEEILDYRDHFAKLDSRLTAINLQKLQSYLTACSLLDYQVPDETQKVIQEDFVETRQADPKEMTIEDFQRLLGLVRLMALSLGRAAPTVEMWQRVKAMEEQRKLRLTQQPRSAAAAQPAH